MKKDELYSQWVLMEKEQPCNVMRASCTCPAGLGEGCTHVAGLLFAIEALNQQDNAPCTSKPCQWNKPLKRKLTGEKVANINFKRFKYDINNKSTEDMELKKKPASSVMNKNGFFTTLCSNLGNSNAVLFHLHDFSANPQFNPEDDINVVKTEEVSTTPYIPSYADSCIDLKSMIRDEELSKSDFLQKMYKIGSSDIEEIELKTRGQSDNQLWSKVRSCRLTASSNFHDIKIRKQSTPDTKLVDAIVSSDTNLSKDLSNVPSLKWGKKHEPIARKRYIAYKKLKNKEKVTVLETGIFLCEGKGYLGASPDGIASIKGENRLLEIKCPISWRYKTVTEACSSKEFYCCIDDGKMKLKENHKYYTQIQGLMAICKLKKCDFVVYTLKDIKIIEIDFNEQFWDSLLPKLDDFYVNSVIPRLFG